MNKKNLYLIAAILAGVVFFNSLTMTEAPKLFGSAILYKLAWFIMLVSNSMFYIKQKKAEEKTSE